MNVTYHSVMYLLSNDIENYRKPKCNLLGYWNNLKNLGLALTYVYWLLTTNSLFNDFQLLANATEDVINILLNLAS